MDSDEENKCVLMDFRRESERLLDKLLEDNKFELDDCSHNLSFDQPERKRKVTRKDPTFRFHGNTELEKRKSSRLLKIKPEYTYDNLLDDDDEDGERRKSRRRRRSLSSSDELDHLDEIVHKPKRARHGANNASVPFVAVEDITDDYIAKISNRSGFKTYSDNGTCCHQCRQKTLDSKTYCRSGRCSGARGQFCGPCLQNRYGESVAEALRDPNWACPPCRDCCNCSICRNRAGRRPTGILAPLAQAQGHKSVKDFLISLNGRGDFREVKDKKYEEVDEDAGPLLLGFSENKCLMRGDFVEGREVVRYERDKLVYEESLDCVN